MDEMIDRRFWKGYSREIGFVAMLVLGVLLIALLFTIFQTTAEPVVEKFFDSIQY